MYRIFNIQKSFILPQPLLLCVLCGSENKQRLFPYTALTGLVCITEVESVCCAVRIESYITQTRFVFKGLIYTANMSCLARPPSFGKTRSTICLWITNCTNCDRRIPITGVFRLKKRHSADDFISMTFTFARKYLNLAINLCPGNDAVSLGNQTSTFRTNILSLSSRVNTMYGLYLCSYPPSRRSCIRK